MHEATTICRLRMSLWFHGRNVSLILKNPIWRCNLVRTRKIYHYFTNQMYSNSSKVEINFDKCVRVFFKYEEVLLRDFWPLLEVHLSRSAFGQPDMSVENVQKLYVCMHN